MVHVGPPFFASIPPLAVLAGSVFLLLNGAGPLSVDEALRARAAGVRLPARAPGL